MKLSERLCEVCGALADGTPSAHFARVMWLCQAHSTAFHEVPQAETGSTWFSLARAATTTPAAWAVLDSFRAVTQLAERCATSLPR